MLQILEIFPHCLPHSRKPSHSIENCKKMAGQLKTFALILVCDAHAQATDLGGDVGLGLILRGEMAYNGRHLFLHSIQRGKL